MNQPIQEQLSALMDGELRRDETIFLLRRIDGEPDLCSRWSAYHVARQTLRRQEVLPLPANFAALVMARIEAEAIPSGRTLPWMRWAGGGAVAASVAIVALVATAPQIDGIPAAGQVTTAASTGVTTPSVSATGSEFRPPLLSPSLAVQPVSASSGGYSGQVTPIDPRLQSYLVRHYDAAPGAGQPAMLPYVLLIVPSQQQAAAGTSAESAQPTAERR